MKALVVFFTACRCNKFKIYELIWEQSPFKCIQIQKVLYDPLTAFHVQAGTGHMSLIFSTDSGVSHPFATLTVASAHGHPGFLLSYTQAIYEPAFLRLILWSPVSPDFIFSPFLGVGWISSSCHWQNHKAAVTPLLQCFFQKSSQE